MENNDDQIEDSQELAKPFNERLTNEFERFCEYHPPKRLSKNLRSLLLEFLMYDGAAEAEYLRDLVIDLDGLFTLLDAIDDEFGREDSTNL